MFRQLEDDMMMWEIRYSHPDYGVKAFSAFIQAKTKKKARKKFRKKYPGCLILYIK